MTFSAPWMFVLLAAIPVLLVLHRRRAPRVVRVASVEPYRGTGAGRPTAERRAVDPLLIALVASVVCVAFAAAGPSWTAGRAGIRLIVDRSVSMSARLESGRGTVGDDAESRARSAVAAAMPDAEIVSQDIAHVRDLSAAVAAARSDGYGGVVFVTDTDLAATDPTVVVCGPSGPAGPNVSLRSVVAERGRVTALVRNHSRVPLDGFLVAASSPGVGFRVEASGWATVVVDVVDPAPQAAEIPVRLVVEGDSLDADDAVVRRRGDAERRALLTRPVERVRAALRALGWTVVADGAHELRVDVGPTEPGDWSGPRVALAPDPGATVAGMRVVAGPRDVEGATLVRRGAHAFPIAAPSCRLVATGRVEVPEGVGSDIEVLLEDAAGVLAARRGPAVVVALDPESPGTDWHADGSFVATVGAAADLAAGAAAEAGDAGLHEADESAVAGADFPDPDPAAIRAIARRVRAADAGPLLAVAGAVAAAAAAWLGRRR